MSYSFVVQGQIDPALDSPQDMHGHDLPGRRWGPQVGHFVRALVFDPMLVGQNRHALGCKWDAKVRRLKLRESL